MTLGPRIIVGLRCSLRLEAPVASGGRVLVPQEYLAMLVDTCNDKQRTNWQRVTRLHALLMEPSTSALGAMPVNTPTPRSTATVCTQHTRGAPRGKKAPGKKSTGALTEQPLQWAPLLTTATSWVGSDSGAVAWLRRWGHSLCGWGSGRLVVCGGYGGPGAHTRLADVVVLDVHANRVVRLEALPGGWQVSKDNAWVSTVVCVYLELASAVHVLAVYTHLKYTHT